MLLDFDLPEMEWIGFHQKFQNPIPRKYNSQRFRNGLKYLGVYNAWFRNSL